MACPRPLALAVVLASAACLVASAAAAKPKGPPKGRADDAPAFDRGAAASALSAVDLAKCKATNARRGEGHVTVTFAPSGTVSSATVDRGPMLGTPVAKCIQTQYTKATIPAFRGDPVVVGKSFRFE